MWYRRASVLVVAVVVGVIVWSSVVRAGDEPKRDLAAQKLQGLLVAKGADWVEIIPDQEEKAVRYLPQWIGGLPKDGGGLDKEMVARIAKLVVPNRVKMEVAFDEHPRILKIELLMPEKKEGTLRGLVVAKGENWIDIKSDEGIRDRYWPRWIGGLPKDGGGFDKELLKKLGEFAAGTRVEVKWMHDERLRVVAITKLNE